MKNKADLYKIQNPHDWSKDSPDKITFKVIIGTYERGRTIAISANSAHEAINIAKEHCKSYEEVIQVSRDGVILWRHEYLG